ncbi:hypothetical protein EI42_04362 [Thermosporothrix hazakensis]|uniref:Uncharacterized protein n=1 Tax=Thermosporothrix hazakensis TaxID=644383 RepID=A0A326U2P2_THEHA|nr:hypothetical protein [Thermosporothrix hazakensis]PZW25310.1 hypothetical protein EI42_04362 [Thermosporothrix hazakensis]GCE50542.1 hypothetical protein KTH_54110 [Thermosporothrix hazakensis]
MERTGPINRNEWVTASEAAEILGTTPHYIRTLAKQYGKLDYYKLNARTSLYYKPQLEELTINRPGRPPRTTHPEKQQQAKWNRWNSIKERLTKAVDGRGRGIDAGILETVVALNALSLHTVASCEGHLGPNGEDEGTPYPWFEIEADPASLEGLPSGTEIEIRQHLLARAKLQLLLDDFYRSRFVPLDQHLVIQGLVLPGSVPMTRVEPQGAGLQDIRSPEEKRHALVTYQQEMRDFTNFLKERFWKE